LGKFSGFQEFTRALWALEFHRDLPKRVSQEFNWTEGEKTAYNRFKGGISTGIFFKNVYIICGISHTWANFYISWHPLKPKKCRHFWEKTGLETWG